MVTASPNLHRDQPNRRIALVWLALCVILCLVGMNRIAEGHPLGPDDALRLVQVRDLLAGQGWFDLHQYRIDPVQGTLMHWSRLVDIPLAIVIGILTPLLGSSLAEKAALVIVPLLTLGAILMVIGRLAWRLLGLEVATYACLIIALTTTVLFQIQPLRIDHHGWQVFLACVALAALAGPRANYCSIIAGLAMAAGISISLEMLPIAAIFGIALTWRWIRNYEKRWWLVAYLYALALGLLGCFILTRGLGDLVQYCDAVSPAHITFFITTALTTHLIAKASHRLPAVVLIGLLGVSGLAGLALFAWSSPQCLAAPFGELDPLVREYWYLNVVEGRPIWEQDLSWALPMLVQLIAGLIAAACLARRDINGRGGYWREYTLILAGAILQAIFVWRSVAIAGAFAVIPLAWITVLLFKCLRKTDRTEQKLLAAALIMLILLPSSPVHLFNAFSRSATDDTAEVGASKTSTSETGTSGAEDWQSTSINVSKCELREQAAKLDQYPLGTIFAPLDIGPVILLESNHAVVATAHHRANLAMRDVISAYIATPDKARTIIAAHNAQYVVLCADLDEITIYAQDNPDGLASLLLAGQAPDWLVPVAHDGPKEFQMWRVKSIQSGQSQN